MPPNAAPRTNPARAIHLMKTACFSGPDLDRGGHDGRKKKKNKSSSRRLSLILLASNAPQSRCSRVGVGTVHPKKKQQHYDDDPRHIPSHPSQDQINDMQHPKRPTPPTLKKHDLRPHPPSIGPCPHVVSLRPHHAPQWMHDMQWTTPAYKLRPSHDAPQSTTPSLQDTPGGPQNPPAVEDPLPLLATPPASVLPPPPFALFCKIRGNSSLDPHMIRPGPSLFPRIFQWASRPDEMRRATVNVAVRRALGSSVHA